MTTLYILLLYLVRYFHILYIYFYFFRKKNIIFYEERRIYMLTEQNKKDIIEMYNNGFSIGEICDEYCGIDPKEICNICEEEYRTWDAE